MSRIKHSADFDYSCEQMFRLVADVNQYQNFIPKCYHSRVDNASDEFTAPQIPQSYDGVLAFGRNKPEITFSTRNKNYAFEKIELTLLSGPFRHLDGVWKFSPHPRGCTVSCELDFQFSNPLWGMFQSKFSAIIGDLLSAIEQQAHKTYGCNRG